VQFKVCDPLISVYIHWPFCRTRCSYCPFIALACHDEYMERYNASLNVEISRFAQSNALCSLQTLYIGGGTPSTWPDRLLLDTSGKILSVFDTRELKEVTIEVNPGTVTEDQLVLWRRIGINRLSIGVQYADGMVLKNLNRYHTQEDVIRLLGCAGHYFDNISVDLMLGLPGVDGRAWQRFIQEVVTWPITHISLYCLMVHENTPLFYQIMREDVKLPSETLIADLYCWSVEFLAKYNFHQYEVSNFAKPGYQSQHNKIYWDRKSYKGFGLGACSFDGSRRFANEQNIVRYIEKLERGELPEVFIEELVDEDVRLEIIMLGLRRTTGVRYEQLAKGGSFEKKCALNNKIEQFCQAGLLRYDGDRIALTPAGFVVEQEVIAELV
jgi:oxygen-independent coproporphyrinogen III oxidase